ncbi:MAG: AAA family ATPase [Faecalimonas sp.]|nr:AAA family ATPase [Faecalimonas sp.]
MKITEVYLKNFGKFHEERISFHDGINLFYGENESGKTTIHTFIKCMLFGLERGRGRAAVGDTFTLYEPWENPNHYAGMLRFESGGKHFCLSRSFDKYGKSASLICEDDGEEFSLEQGDLELILPGITAANYENTIAVGQMKVETNQSLAQELQNYATNYYATGNGDMNLVGAQELLAKQKKEVEKEIRNLEQERQQKRRDIARDLESIGRDVSALDERIQELNRQIEEEHSWEREVVEVAREEDAKKSRAGIRAGEWLLILLGMLAAYLFLPAAWKYIFPCALLAIEGILICYRKRKAVQQRQEPMESEESLSKLSLQKEILEEEWKEKQVRYENTREAFEELDEKDAVYKQKEKKREALEFAMQQLTVLAKETNQEIGNRLNERVSQIVKEITGGKYELLRVDSDLKISLYADGRKLALEQVSRGTIEQIYFALRMAASELLHEEEYPIILDDTFVFYDEIRLANTLRWLQENKKQVLLFTCQKREGEVLKELLV